LFCQVDNLLDQAFPGIVLGMGLAGEDELHPVETQVEEILEIGEDERRPLVGRGAAGEANGQQFVGEASSGNRVDIADEPLLGMALGLLDGIVGNAVSLSQDLRLFPPGRQIFVK